LFFFHSLFLPRIVFGKKKLKRIFEENLLTGKKGKGKEKRKRKRKREKKEEENQ